MKTKKKRVLFFIGIITIIAIIGLSMNTNSLKNLDNNKENWSACWIQSRNPGLKKSRSNKAHSPFVIIQEIEVGVGYRTIRIDEDTYNKLGEFCYLYIDKKTIISVEDYEELIGESSPYRDKTVMEFFYG